MSALVKLNPNVGVAPGTTTMQLGQIGGTRRVWDPYTDMISLNDSTIVAPPMQDRPIRWDIVFVVGGGSLLVALGAAFLAAAIGRR